MKDEGIRRFVSLHRRRGPRGRHADLGNITHSIHQPTEAPTSAFIPSFKHFTSLPISPFPDSSVAPLPQNDTHSHTHLCTTTVILSDCRERRISPCFLLHHLNAERSLLPNPHSISGGTSASRRIGRLDKANQIFSFMSRPVRAEGILLPSPRVTPYRACPGLVCEAPSGHTGSSFPEQQSVGFRFKLLPVCPSDS